MIAFLILALLQQPASFPVAVADTSPFRRLEFPTPSLTRGASGMPGPQYWQQRADYTIRVSLDTATHLLSGTAVIRYVNNSPDTLRYVWLHLEQNLFRPESRGAALNAAPNNEGMQFAGEWFEGAGITVTTAAAVRRSLAGDAQRTPLTIV